MRRTGGFFLYEQLWGAANCSGRELRWLPSFPQHTQRGHSTHKGVTAHTKSGRKAERGHRKAERGQVFHVAEFQKLDILSDASAGSHPLSYLGANYQVWARGDR